MSSNKNTLAIKARVYNQVRTDLYKRSSDDLSTENKLELFEKWFSLNKEAHKELNKYKAKRKAKKLRDEARIARGWVPKQRTTFLEWTIMCSQLTGMMAIHNNPSNIAI